MDETSVKNYKVARPLRVWKYRGWCWLCRIHKTSGFDLASQEEAMDAVLEHCKATEELIKTLG